MTMIESSLEDVTLTSLVLGPEHGPLALCLHGFPDTARTFRHLAPHLAQLGYRVVAPFMRGYFPSSVSKTNNYQIAALASDACTLHEMLGGDERAVLIGHDWGAAAAYAAAGAQPQRWRRVVTMSVPPLATFANSLSDYEQLRASWYMFYFQNPQALSVVGRDRLAFLARLWADWSPGYEAGADMEHVREALGREEHLRAALGYYRAMFASTELVDPRTAPFRDAMFEAPRVPTLYLHGEQDGCFIPAGLGDPLSNLAAGSRFEVVGSAGHFVHLERPAKVAELITAFLEH